MNAVGIDVSKGKSMVAALRPMGEVALLPQEFLHTEVGLEQMAYAIIALGEDTRVVMEATGRYHEPVAAALHEYGIYVCVLNPLFIKQSGGGSIRKVKTDKADAMKIAKYGLDNWVDLREYTPMDTVRQQLKLCSRQYNLYMKTVVSLQNNLISLTDKTFHGVNELFSSPERADGHQKWVDFVMTFWHCDCICRVSEKAFTERYQKWCMRKGYHFSAEKALDVYAGSCGHCVHFARPHGDFRRYLREDRVRESGYHQKRRRRRAVPRAGSVRVRDHRIGVQRARRTPAYSG